MKFCWHKWTKWQTGCGIRWALGFHGTEGKTVESRTCIKCGKVECRIVKEDKIYK